MAKTYISWTLKLNFFNENLHEETYVTQARRYVLKGHKNMVCKLKKALYGLKKAPQAWYEKIHAHLAAHIFRTIQQKDFCMEICG